MQPQNKVPTELNSGASCGTVGTSYCACASVLQSGNQAIQLIGNLKEV